MRPSACPLIFYAENWHTVYSCPGKHLCQFWFSYISVFQLGVPTERTDRQTGKTRTAACRVAYVTCEAVVAWKARNISIYYATVSFFFVLHFCKNVLH